MSITIALASSQRFVRHCNGLLFFVGVGGSYITAQQALPWLYHLALLICIFVYGMFLICRAPTQISHVLITEGDIGNCKGLLDVPASIGATPIKLIPAALVAPMMLSERKSRLTRFGCWLAFEASTNKKCAVKFQVAKLQWVFLPKFLLSESQYKSICRHLIWHVH